MIQDQNRIELQVRNSIYEEFILRGTNTGYCLPGTIVATTEDSQEFVTNTVDSRTFDLQAFETFVILENALLGKGINAKSFNGERILCRRAVSGDVLLIRAVTGDYRIGQPVYATQTSNGIYVTNERDGKFVGWAQEDFTVTPSMVDLVDDSTSERPSTVNLNGVIVNLLRVRIGGMMRALPSIPITRFSVAAIDELDLTTKLRIVFREHVDAPLTSPLQLSDIQISGGASLSNLVLVDTVTFEVDVTFATSGLYEVMIAKANVSDRPVRVNLGKSSSTIETSIGWYGVVYPTNLSSIGNVTFPTIDDSVLKFAATVEITGEKRTLVTTPEPLQEDWDVIGFSPPVPFSQWDDLAYRTFICIRGNDWGEIRIGDSTESFDQTAGWTDFSMTVNGIVYNGKYSPNQGATTPVNFRFL